VIQLDPIAYARGGMLTLDTSSRQCASSSCAAHGVSRHGRANWWRNTGRNA